MPAICTKTSHRRVQLPDSRSPVHGELLNSARDRRIASTCSCQQPSLSCSVMKDLLILIAHLLTTIATLLGLGGARAIIADRLLMKQQFLITNRHRKRVPRLTPLDRFLLGFWSLFLINRRIQQAAVIIRPSTLLKFHQLLKQRKYRLLYASARKTKTGPKGP